MFYVKFPLYDWAYSINPLELGLAIVFGIMASYIASIIFAKRTTKREQKLFNKKFKPIEGTYIRWFNEDKTTGQERIHARAHLIHYKGENRLSIRVETFMRKDGTTRNPTHEWTGECIMDTNKSGSVVWEQRKPNERMNGFKRIIIGEDQESITLVGEQEHGFGIEKFTEKERKQNQVSL